MHDMRVMPGVQETISSLYTERLEVAEHFIKSLAKDDFILVADVHDGDEYRLVGSIGISIDTNPRRRHVGRLGIMVRTDWQGKGIGRKLLAKIIDLSDNWLMLKRIELTVFAENEEAIRLYQSFGFEVEGCLHAGMVKDGAYADMLIMGWSKQ